MTNDMHDSSSRLPVEIILIISQHLDRTNIIKCLLINRDWHDALEPLLWDEFTWHDPPSIYSTTTPPASLIQKNVSYIRTLHLRNGCQPAPACPLWLTTLSVTDYVNPSAELMIIQQNLGTLQYYAFARTQPQDRYSNKTQAHAACAGLKALVNCHALRTLRLRFVRVADEDGDAFLQICERLEWLSLVHCQFEKDPLRDRCGESQDPFLHRLKRLVVVGHEMSSLDKKLFLFLAARPLAPSSSSSPSATTVSKPDLIHDLTWSADKDQLENFYSIVSFLSTRCSHLTRLDISWSTLTDIQIATVIGGTPMLTSFIAEETKVSHNTIEILLGSPRGKPDGLTPILEELNLKGCLVRGVSVDQILRECTRLRRFWTNTKTHVKIILTGMAELSRFYPEIDFMTAEGIQDSSAGSLVKWNCPDLQELEIGICGMYAIKTRMDPQLALVRVLDKIVEFKQLEVLTLKIAPNAAGVFVDLSNIAILRRLKLLPKLRELIIHDQQNFMTKGVLKTIAETLPTLERIGFTVLNHSHTNHYETMQVASPLVPVVPLPQNSMVLQDNIGHAAQIYIAMDKYLKTNHPRLKRIPVFRKTCLFD
ncbi:hypothetical protein BG011_002180 [Mortierella polycephala]|uniref:F-box domain-containing protein n=1 Tax=Mortierella polycephala TaxID=41804 RepID=A0A9P6Q4Y2_9FUNG|nr:hypothetical protein BG011_002180 [Mortierella polycephala]